MITDVEAYFAKGCGRCERFDTDDCSTLIWSKGVLALREVVLGCGVVETAKWGHPCYMHAGVNIAIMGAFRADFRISFMRSSLLSDPEGFLQRQGPNTKTPDMLAFSSVEKVQEMAPAIQGFIKQLQGFAEAGIKPQRDSSAPDLPDDLVEALDADPDLAEAFHRLTPGRQRSYVIALSSAKALATRQRRIDGFRAGILAGRGAMER